MPQTSNLAIMTQQLSESDSLLTPFALTDLLIHEANSHQQAFLHFWETPPTVILGMKDTRVPQLKEGLNFLKRAHYQPIARNSGGLAVISEPGVLNFSIVIPNPIESPLSVTAAYEVMTKLIQDTFAPWSTEIVAKEIPDSYCPGEFDLSIHNKKFAGISQRRIANGIAIMIYLSISGDQATRGETIRDFYHASLGNAFGEEGYPPVEPTAMANLTDLLETDWTVTDVKELIIKQASLLTNREAMPLKLDTFLADDERHQAYQRHLAKMKQRNQDILPTGGLIDDSI